MHKVKDKGWNTLWCCNPFGLEKHSRKIGKRKVTEVLREKESSLVLGDVICISCCVRIYKMKTKPDETVREASDSNGEECPSTLKRSSEEEYTPDVAVDTVSTLNTILTPLGESPISKSKLSRVKSYSRRKYTSVDKALKTNILMCLLTKMMEVK